MFKTAFKWVTFFVVLLGTFVALTIYICDRPELVLVGVEKWKEPTIHDERLNKVNELKEQLLSSKNISLKKVTDVNSNTKDSEIIQELILNNETQQWYCLTTYNINGEQYMFEQINFDEKTYARNFDEQWIKVENRDQLEIPIIEEVNSINLDLKDCVNVEGSMDGSLGVVGAEISANQLDVMRKVSLKRATKELNNLKNIIDLNKEIINFQELIVKQLEASVYSKMKINYLTNSTEELKGQNTYINCKQPQIQVNDKGDLDLGTKEKVKVTSEISVVSVNNDENAEVVKKHIDLINK